MSMGLPSARVGVAPSIDESKRRSSRLRRTEDYDDDPDIVISSDDDEKAKSSSSPDDKKSGTGSFLKISVSADMKSKLARRATAPRVPSQRDQRRNSVLKSLAMLDVMDGDDDLEQFAAAAAADDARRRPSITSDRYLRRGSVTKHHLQPNVGGMQPTSTSSHADDADADAAEQDQGHKPLGETSAAAMCSQEDMDLYGYASDSYASDTHASASRADAAAKLAQKRRSSGHAHPPLTASSNAAATAAHSRYLRRGSVTRHKPVAEVGTMQPCSHHGEEDYGYNTDDASSVVSMPPLSSSAGFDSSHNQHHRKPPRYQRRGSVTKFSLEESARKPLPHPSAESDDDDVDYGYNTDDNASVVSMPPMSSSASFDPSKNSSRRKNYQRRGSVTKYSLEQESGSSSRSVQPDFSSSEVDLYGYNTDDNASVVSMPPISSSASFDPSKNNNRRKSYQRRGSVTKYSLEQKTDSSSRSMQPDSGSTEDDLYGYNTDDNASVVSMPPLSSSASFDLSKNSSRRKSYQRRGSVTKYSLEQNTDSTSRLMQPDGSEEGGGAGPAAAAAARKHQGKRDEDIDIETDSDDEPTPKRGDDNYSENLEDSGRYGRRTVPMDDSDSEDDDDDKIHSKQPPLPRSFSASGVGNNNSIPKVPPRRSLVGRHHELEDDSGHCIKRTEDANRKSQPLEDDSGHIKKTWYKDISNNSATRRDSMSSLESENSEGEFGSEPQLQGQKKPKSPPKLPPSYKKNKNNKRGPSLSSYLLAQQRPSQEKMTIDGGGGGVSVGNSYNDSSSFANSAAFEDSSSVNGSDDEDAAPRKHVRRSRRTSIVGIPAVDPTPVPAAATPPASTTSSSIANKKTSKEATAPAKPKTKKALKPKLLPSTKKSNSSTSGIKNSVFTAPNATSTATRGLKGCLKAPGSAWASMDDIPKRVRFGNLVITEFPIILGDNPAVTSGAPVTIDWHPQKESRFSVNAYEQARPRRRRRRKLLISVSNRAILLLAAGYSIDDIADASIDAQQIKLGRQQTLENQSWNRFLETTGDISGIFLQPLQSTGKKLKSMMLKPQPQLHSEGARMA